MKDVIMRMIRIGTLSLPVLIGLPTIVQAAYYYEAKTTTETNQNGSQVSTVHAWVDGQSSKVEFVDGKANPMFSAGSYLLTNDGGKTLYVVNTEKKTVSEVDLEQIFSMIGNITNASKGLIKMEFSDFKSQKLGEEPGEKILGYATTHYRFKRGYTTTVRVLGFKRASRVDSEVDFSCAKALDDAGFKVWLQPGHLHTGNADIDKVIAQQYSTLSCLPLRSKTVSTLTAPKGDVSTTTTTTEVTTLRQAAAPAGTFTIPAGYQKTSLVPDFSAAAASENGADSGASPDSQQQEEQQPKKKRRLRLKDLFGR